MQYFELLLSEDSTGGECDRAPLLEPPQQSCPQLRCLDPTHLPGCRTCVPAPPEGEEDAWQLCTGAASAASQDAAPAQSKGGLKLLRALVLSTAEWRDADARERAAAASSPSLAAVLRTSAHPKDYLPLVYS
jgi:hypothetical protein